MRTPPERGWIGFSLLALFFGAGLCAGAPVAGGREDTSPGAAHRANLAWAQPLVELPKHIAAPAGKLTLYADFVAKEEGGVPLYVINRSDAPVCFMSQDSDIYLKLERQAADGRWERAQSHVGSDCGVSYDRRFLS